MLNMEVPHNYARWCGYYQDPWVSFVTTYELSTRVLKITLCQKEVLLFPKIGCVKNFSSVTHPHSQMSVRIYTFS